ncbi:MAG: cytochrome c biogenesis protein ResB [Phycisphaerae bacterium]|nr:cytochrome c biogenesis protein ResB [Phycisphaerae bacterium]
MRPILDWHRTTLGRIVLFLGSVQFAVPVLFLVAAAMAWATYIESTQNAKAAKATVYASGWFIALMGLICVSLVFAVITRFPWKRRHVGFITVHAGLVVLIAGGFWSLFTRVEGHLTLEEGKAGDVMEVDREIVELVEFNAGRATTLATRPAPTRVAPVTLGSVTVRVVDLWPNTREEQFVSDDGPAPFRAVEIATAPNAASGDWIGDEARSGGPATVGGLTVRVLRDGSTWEPPPPPPAAGESGFHFLLDGTRHSLGAVGDEAIPGWRIVALESFTHAMVSGGRITERGEGQSNPAVDVTISNGRGTSERHTAFLNFPDMIMMRKVEGEEASGARLTAAAAAAASTETLIVFGPVDAPRLGYVGPDGAGRELTPPASFPAVVDLGARRITLLNHASRARVASRFTRAPTARDRRPAIIVELEGASTPIVVPWKGAEPVPVQGRNLALRYGPRLVRLPFTVHLKDFRKSDYPGTQMAMAYESDVTVTTPQVSDEAHTISMNEPYAYAPWKVYQSGFIGEKVSVFSIMKDPGLPMTYAGSIILCVGIFITFFSRTLSWGHPGIPAAPPVKEVSHACADSVPAARPADAVADPVGAGV